MKAARITIALGLAGLTFGALSAQAQFVDGNRLFSHMTGNAMDRAHAYGYVSGIYDTMKTYAFCPPSSVTVGQVNDMVQQFLETNPQHRSHAGDQIVVHVLRRAWPCKKDGT